MSKFKVAEEAFLKLASIERGSLNAEARALSKGAEEVAEKQKFRLFNTGRAKATRESVELGTAQASGTRMTRNAKAEFQEAKRAEQAIKDQDAVDQSILGNFGGVGETPRPKVVTEEPTVPKTKKTISNVLDQKKFHTQEAYTENRILKQEANIMSAQEQALKLNAENKLSKAQQEMYKKDGVVNAGTIEGYYAGQREGIKRHTTLGDKMLYNQVPQKAAAIGGTAWVVSSMSQSKGHMDNSELYGQKMPYGG